MTSTKFKEKRAHRRLDIRLPLEYRRQESPRANMFRTNTVNVSTGGVFFITTVDDFKPGDKLAFDLGVPPGDGRFPQEGKFSTTGQVVRTSIIDNTPNAKGVSIPRYGVAARFQQGFKLTF